MPKITVLEPKTFQGKPTGFKVTLDDGRGGNLEEKQSDKGLRVGDEVVVTEIPYVSKAGNKSTLYGLRLNNGTVQTPAPQPAATPTLAPKPAPQAPVSPPSGKITEANIFGAQANGATTLMTTVLEAVLEGKVTNVVALEKYHEFQAVLEQTIDALAGKK